MSAPDLRLSLSQFIMAGQKRETRFQGIDPAIHVLDTKSWTQSLGHQVLATKKGVDARHKAGHDGEEQS